MTNCGSNTTDLESYWYGGDWFEKELLLLHYPKYKLKCLDIKN
jgi:hypothetical protein